MSFNPTDPSAMDIIKRSKFPAFEDGDVTISLSPSEEGKLVLHSTKLRQCSKFFDAGLSERWSSSKYSNGITTTGSAGLSAPKIRYELCLDDDGQDWFLIRKASESSTRDDRRKDIKRFNLPHRQPLKIEDPVDVPRLGCEGVRYLKETNPFSEVVRDHRNLFALLYNAKVRLRSPDTAKDILGNVVYLADVYGCLPSISHPIERCIIQSGHAGYDGIVQHPCFYLNLATKIRSRLIFEEAIRHAVGRYESLKQRERMSLTDDIAAKVRLKRDQLLVKVSHVRQQISTLEGCLSAEDPDTWLAAAIFRDWASTTIFQISPTWERGAYFYQQLVFYTTTPRGLAFFLEKADRSEGFAPFLAIVDRDEVNKSLDGLLSLARRIAQPLFKGYPGEVPAKSPLSDFHCYFTHCKIIFNDLPWADKVPWDGWIGSEDVSPSALDEAFPSVVSEEEISDLEMVLD
ncbi:MAG: hypothetical protein M1835_006536 [Candelina submexicana]|nr:MAG: hypothetical protein M1835_006536 [Candelina submexicana]